MTSQTSSASIKALHAARNFARKFRGLFSAQHSTPNSASLTPASSSCQVLFVNGCDLPLLRRYRVEHQREQLELWGVSTDEVHYTQINEADADRADTFVVYRCPITPQIESFIKRAHLKGKKVWFDIDDLVTSTSYTDELPVVKSMSDADRAVFNDGVERCGQTLALCDGAIVTTEALARELGKVVPQAFINRNVASQEMLRRSRRAVDERSSHDNRSVIIGYFSGSMTHNADFEEAVDALADIMKAHDNVYLKVVGDLELPSQLLAYDSRVIHAEKVDWRELPKLIASVDINLAPLEATLFNEAKSENKWTEASLVGVPTVASNFGAFARVIKQNETGLLCESREEWRLALERLVLSSDERKRIGDAARSFVETHSVTERTGFGLADFLVGVPHDLAHLCPADETAKMDWVRSFLRSRGVIEQSSSEQVAPDWKSGQLQERAHQASDILAAGNKLAILVYERNCGDDATFRYFGLNTEEHLLNSDSWGAVHVFVDELAEAKPFLSKASLFVLIRCRIRPELVELAAQAKANNIPMAYLIDDDTLGAERAPRIIQAMATNPQDTFERDFWTGCCKRFQLAADLCDSYIVPNSFFAQRVAERTDKPVAVLRSSLNKAQVNIADRVHDGGISSSDGKFVIGYFSGTSSHQDDFGIVKEPLINILRNHDDALLLLGGSLNLDDELLTLYRHGPIIPMPRVDYVTLQQLQSACDVVLAPLVVDDFTNCKSGLKVFEAGVVGTPACASNACSYIEAIEDGKSGFLCATEADWSHALESLYEDANLRSAMSMAARELALSRYYGTAAAQSTESALDSASNAPMRPTQANLNLSGDVNWDNPFDANPLFS